MPFNVYSYIVRLPTSIACPQNGIDSTTIFNSAWANSTGSAQPTVPLNAIRKFPIPPLEEQRRLVAYMGGLQAQVSQLRHYQEEMQKELDILMPSVLDKAFKGEL